MVALILCGGLGTRLRARFPDRPKSLAPVAGRPFLEWQLDWLARGGVTHAHLAAGHRADALARWAAAWRGPVRTTVSAEPAALGTGGGLRFAASFLPGDSFLVLNGDSLCPSLDFQQLEKSAADFSEDWKAVLAVAPIEEAGRYGTVEFESNGRITAFREKASRDAGWINAGVYLVRRALLDEIPAEGASSLETDLFPRLVAAGQLHAVPVAPPLLDMGTPEGLAAMETFLGT
jgi:D-glycero-alpha-D-manno-heptose 1-phosphate guanylyltransferase